MRKMNALNQQWCVESDKSGYIKALKDWECVLINVLINNMFKGYKNERHIWIQSIQSVIDVNRAIAIDSKGQKKVLKKIKDRFDAMRP